jgi:hydroxymethylbilane synthase
MEDVLISAQPYTLDTLPQGARVGTSSVRRARQLLYLRPDLKIDDLRGNVPTRVKKCLGEGAFDAILLATAGVLRLNLLDLATKKITIEGATLHAHILDAETFFPAACQGTIAVEVRSNDQRTYDAVRALNHAETEARILAEREFLRLLGAGCQTPLGVRTWITGQSMHMAVRLFSTTDPSAKPREASGEATIDAPMTLARIVHRQLS